MALLLYSTNSVAISEKRAYFGYHRNSISKLKSIVIVTEINIFPPSHDLTFFVKMAVVLVKAYFHMKIEQISTGGPSVKRLIWLKTRIPGNFGARNPILGSIMAVFILAPVQFLVKITFK